MRKYIFLLTAFILLTTVAAGLLGWHRYKNFLETPLELPEAGYILLVAPGSSGRSIVNQITEQGFSRASWQWRMLMRLEPVVIRAGEYELSGLLLPRDLLARLASGAVVQYRFTLVEGWNFRQMMEALEAQTVLSGSGISEVESEWPAVISDLAIEHPEGWFLPETYLFTRGDSVFDVLARAHRAMQVALDKAWAVRSEDNPLKSPYEVLILASIIEKETALDSERAEIAGVFARRLQKGMRLQTDPTVIYGLGASFDGDLRRRDLKTDSPYNTYTRSGLPPTPIAMPSVQSLMAAAQPAAGETLYFVANGDGGHTFSATLKEHQAAVNQLIRRK